MHETCQQGENIKALWDFNEKLMGRLDRVADKLEESAIHRGDIDHLVAGQKAQWVRIDQLTDEIKLLCLRLERHPTARAAWDRAVEAHEAASDAIKKISELKGTPGRVALKWIYAASLLAAGALISKFS
jgi:hypothetical protein